MPSSRASSSTMHDPDTGIRVTIAPSEAAYFAGEPFKVTITLKNTRSRLSPAASQSALLASPSLTPTPSYTHRRGAHSISSAPLSKPPTSPGTPKLTPVSGPYSGSGRNGKGEGRDGEGLPRKRGLVGKERRTEGWLDESRKRLVFGAKSFSIDLSPGEVEELGVRRVKGDVPEIVLDGETNGGAPNSSNKSLVPNKSPPLTRTSTLPVSAHHPHARKRSTLDGSSSAFSLNQLALSTDPSFQSSQSLLKLDLNPDANQNQSRHQSQSQPTTPGSPTPSVSSFSLALESIAETGTPSTQTSPVPPTPIQPSPDLGYLKHQADSAKFPLPPPPQRPPARSAQSYSHPKPGQGELTMSSRAQSHTQLPPSHSPSPPPTRLGSPFGLPNTEIILYSYAQLSGTLTLLPASSAPPSSSSSPSSDPATLSNANAKTANLNALRTQLLRKRVVGGGSMDIQGQSQKGRPTSLQQHRRASSSYGLLGWLSPAAFSGSTPLGQSQNTTASEGGGAWSPAHKRTQTQTQTIANGVGSGGKVGLGLGLAGIGAGVEEEWDPETPLPVFEVQPAMLAVDWAVGPGEERSYTYTLDLPPNLPPTFRGRCLKFSYELTVGVCRAPPASSAGTRSSLGVNAGGGGGISKVMKVPIRVYNSVVVGRLPRPYDLLWPVARRKEAMPSPKVVEQSTRRGGGARMKRSKSFRAGTAAIPPGLPEFSSLSDLQAYARRLLTSLQPEASLLEAEGESGGLSLPRSDSLSPLKGALELEQEKEEEGGLTGCREAVEILTRNPKKVSYDVNKDGVKVAVLTFTKSAYRLGETVLGAVELNDRSSRARVLKLSAMLEAHESLPSSISSAPANPRNMRRVHAEHHSSFVSSMLRTTFALDIPPDASPAFQIDVSTNNGTDVFSPPGERQVPGGLEWKVRLCLLVAVAQPTREEKEGAKLKGLVRDGPRGEWGTSWRASESVAPMEKVVEPPTNRSRDNLGAPAQSWASYFGSFLGSGEGEYHDGDEEDGEGEGREGEKGEEDLGGGEEGWSEVKVETVECEVPVKVWPGNTAFKAMEVVFDV